MPSRARNKVKLVINLRKAYFTTDDLKTCKTIVQILSQFCDRPSKLISWHRGSYKCATENCYPIFFNGHQVLYTSGDLYPQFTDHIDPELFLIAHERGNIVWLH